MLDQRTADDLTNLSWPRSCWRACARARSRIPRSGADAPHPASRPGPPRAGASGPSPRRPPARARDEAERIVARLLERGRLTLDEAVRAAPRDRRDRPPPGERRAARRRGRASAACCRGARRRPSARSAPCAAGSRPTSRRRPSQRSARPGASAPAATRSREGGEDAWQPRKKSRSARAPAARRAARARPARETWDDTRRALRSAEADRRDAGWRPCVKRSGLEPREGCGRPRLWRSRFDREGRKAMKRGRGAPRRAASSAPSAKARTVARSVDDAVASARSPRSTSRRGRRCQQLHAQGRGAERRASNGLR